MKLQLVFKTAKSGGKKPRTYDVKLPIIIGRGQQASFRIPHGQISRRHCELLESKGSVFIRDLGSTNGTMVKGTMLPSKTKVPIRSGSVIRLGDLTFRINYDEPNDGRAAQEAEDSFEEAIDFLEAEPEGKTVEAFAESGLQPSTDKVLEEASLDDDLFLEADEELNADDDDFLDKKSSSQESSGTLSDDDIDDFLNDI
jgi:pSer/pThr/pTyr-binding forkhead associated (FHA) protein